MGVSTRGWARRKIDMANGNLQTAFLHLKEIEETYEPTEKQIAKALSSQCEILILTAQGLETLKANM